MSVPLELLLGVEELREVNRGFVIAEQLWHGHAQRVHRGKRRRDSISRVGADGIRERRDHARLDLKFHRRVRAPGDRCHARSLEQVNYGLLGRKRARSLRSRSGRSADHASITEARVDGAMSGGAYAAMTKPRASTPTGSKASGNVLCKRRYRTQRGPCFHHGGPRGRRDVRRRVRRDDETPGQHANRFESLWKRSLQAPISDAARTMLPSRRPAWTARCPAARTPR